MMEKRKQLQIIFRSDALLCVPVPFDFSLGILMKMAQT